MDHKTANFDSIARAYRWMEYASFGRMLERCRFHFLTRCSNVRHALVLGDGDGRFTARLLASNPMVHADAVDASTAMLALLRDRARRSCRDAETRLSTTEAEIRTFTPQSADYDLVVSHFFLDCLTDDEASDLVARVSSHTTPEALWLVSEFALPQKGWRRPAARILIRMLYFAFFILTGLRVRRIPNYGNSFRANGFDRVDQATYVGGLLIAEVWKRRSS